MAFEKLSAKDQEIVLRCMRATVAHVEDWEKHSRLGLGSGELKVIIDQWPAIDDVDESGNGFLAINNCLCVRHTPESTPRRTQILCTRNRARDRIPRDYRAGRNHNSVADWPI
jgi:hypothetical protein